MAMATNRLNLSESSPGVKDTSKFPMTNDRRGVLLPEASEEESLARNCCWGAVRFSPDAAREFNETSEMSLLESDALLDEPKSPIPRNVEPEDAKEKLSLCFSGVLLSSFVGTARFSLETESREKFERHLGKESFEIKLSTAKEYKNTP